MKLLNGPPLPNWEEDDFSDSIIEAQLKASLANAQRTNPREEQAAAQPGPRLTTIREQQTQSTSPDADLIASCGIAAIDGYLQMREYAATKGLDLVEFHHKGIDLQDLISTLVIQQQRRAEMEERQAGTRRYSR